MEIGAPEQKPFWNLWDIVSNTGTYWHNAVHGPWGLLSYLLRHMFFFPPYFRNLEAPSSNRGQEEDEWLGFSPTMTRALEEAYQTWQSEATSPLLGYAGLWGFGDFRNVWGHWGADFASSNSSTNLRILDN